LNGGSVIPGDSVQFPFLITNIGNNPTGIYVSTVTGVVPTNLDSNSILIYIDINNDGTPDYVVDKSGQAIPASTGKTNVLYAVSNLTAPLADSTTASGTVDSNITTASGGYIVTSMVQQALRLKQMRAFGSRFKEQFKLAWYPVHW
jgi:hypothetical protein